MLDARQQKEVASEVRQRVAEAEAKPFVTVLAGPTGTGKSTLINACTGAKLPTDAVRPCTLEVSEPIRVNPGPGRELWFYDMPGFLESEEADERYLQTYIEMSRRADIIFWLHHVDCRSVMPQRQFLQRLREVCGVKDWPGVLNKIVFLASKSDQISPPPWICVRDGTRCWFSPQKSTQKLMDAKTDFFAEAILKHFQNDLTSMTYLDDPWPLKDPRFQVEEHEITFRGYMDETTAQEIKKQRPGITAVVDRLRDNHRVIACSSLFRFNLYQLMSVAVQKLGLEAVGRFKKFLAGKDLNTMPLTQGLGLCNLLVFDKPTNQIVFDLTKHV